MIPNIDYGLCTGCGGCAAAYPQFFELRDDKAWVIGPDKCSSCDCKGAADTCPVEAIKFE